MWNRTCDECGDVVQVAMDVEQVSMDAFGNVVGYEISESDPVEFYCTDCFPEKAIEYYGEPEEEPFFPAYKEKKLKEKAREYLKRHTIRSITSYVPVHPLDIRKWVDDDNHSLPYKKLQHLDKFLSYDPHNENIPESRRRSCYESNNEEEKKSQRDKAITYLKAVPYGFNGYKYYSEEDYSWWSLTEDDLIALTKYLKKDNAIGYSLWCADGHGDRIE